MRLCDRRLKALEAASHVARAQTEEEPTLNCDWENVTDISQHQTYLSSVKCWFNIFVTHGRVL